MKQPLLSPPAAAASRASRAPAPRVGRRARRVDGQDWCCCAPSARHTRWRWPCPPWPLGLWPGVARSESGPIFNFSPFPALVAVIDFTCHFSLQQDTFLKSTHTLRAQKFLSKRIISRNTAPPVPFLAPIRSATAGRALTRRPFVDRVGNRRVTDDFVSPATSPATLGGLPKVYPNALAGARGGAGGFSCPHTSAHDQGRHPPSTVCQSDV